MVLSAINALTLSPALCAILLQPSHGARSGIMGRCAERDRPDRDGYSAIVRQLVRRARLVSSSWSAALPRHRRACSRSRRPASCRRRTRAPSSSRCSCPRAPRSTALGGRGRAGRAHRRRSPGVANVSTVRWLQLPRTASHQSNAGFMIVLAEAVRGAHRSAACRSRSIIGRDPARGWRRCARRHVIPFNLPPIIGLGTDRRLRVSSSRIWRAARRTIWRRPCAG